MVSLAKFGSDLGAGGRGFVCKAKTSEGQTVAFKFVCCFLLHFCHALKPLAEYSESIGRRSIFSKNGLHTSTSKNWALPQLICLDTTARPPKLAIKVTIQLGLQLKK